MRHHLLQFCLTLFALFLLPTISLGAPLPDVSSSPCYLPSDDPSAECVQSSKEVSMKDAHETNVSGGPKQSLSLPESLFALINKAYNAEKEGRLRYFGTLGGHGGRGRAKRSARAHP